MEHHILFGELSLKRLLVELGLRTPEDFSGRYEWLIDFREATLNASAEEVRNLGRFVQQYRREHPVNEMYRIAAVAEDDVTYGLYRMFMVYAECANCELFVTRLKQEAVEWLDNDLTSQSNHS